MASGSTNRFPINDEEGEEDQPLLYPKPPSPDPMHREDYVAEILSGDNDVAETADPPPPYPSTNRGSRRSRTTLRSSRRANYQILPQAQTEEIQVTNVGENLGNSETSPLLPDVNRRRRAASHSSTTHSIHSIGQTVIETSRNVMSLFQAEPDAVLDPTLSSGAQGAHFTRTKRYFRPLVQRSYYSDIFHLLFINFLYGLVTWIYLFVGTLVKSWLSLWPFRRRRLRRLTNSQTGTTLLITPPLGVILCFLDLIGARFFARGEIFLQTLFRGPLSINRPNPPNPIFSRTRIIESASGSDSELEEGERQHVAETSLLKLTYLMTRLLFYFLVIKPGITLLIAIGILVLLPPAFILIIPAPAVLRAIRRVDIWQAEIALDALK